MFKNTGWAISLNAWENVIFGKFFYVTFVTVFVTVFVILTKYNI